LSKPIHLRECCWEGIPTHYSTYGAFCHMPGTWPFVSRFRTCLTYVYELSNASVNRTRTRKRTNGLDIRADNG